MLILILALFFVSIPDALSQSNLELLNQLINTEDQGKVRGVYYNPSQITSLSAKYDLQEIKLQPNEVLYFYVPEKFKNMPLAWLGFYHRQNEPQNSDWDEKPGITSALVYSSSADDNRNNFKFWGGPSSGKWGGKYADRGQYAEYDALYEWQKKGYKTISSSQRKYDHVFPKVIKVQNTGKDTVHFSGIDFQVSQNKDLNISDSIFSPGSDFGNVSNLAGRRYGGGQLFRGTYPGSLVLARNSMSNQPLPLSFKKVENKLSISLKENRTFSFIQIMCGDTLPDQQPNRYGGFGKSGNARINVYISNKITGQRRLLAKHINIPPEGVIQVSEINEQIKLGPGDELVILNDIRKSPLYIMAIRLAYLRD